MELTEGMCKQLNEDLKYIKDPEVKKLYTNCYKCTWETTMNREGEDRIFVITGDIPAMWLRDSSMQVLPYLRLCGLREVKQAFQGLLAKQADQILIDPYANAFNQKGDYACFSKDHTEMGPCIWERKYEVDSLAFHCFLLEKYYQASQDASVLTQTELEALWSVVRTWRTEQHHAEKSPYRFERELFLPEGLEDLGAPGEIPADFVENFSKRETLSNGGLGSPVADTGMTWSGFRPSDDACTYHYLVPSNMLAVSVLKGFASLPLPDALIREADALAREIDAGIARYAIVEHPVYGKIYAYETDGLGHYNMMDDANLPSLLAAPWFGYCSAEDPIYQNTRRYLLSAENPYYHEGKAGRGIGSPHTPKDYIWHLALAVQGLTAQTDEEKQQMLHMIENTTAGTYYVHEGFHKDDASKFTRPWFAWACSMYCLLAEEGYGMR